MHARCKKELVQIQLSKDAELLVLGSYTGLVASGLNETLELAVEVTAVCNCNHVRFVEYAFATV